MLHRQIILLLFNTIRDFFEITINQQSLFFSFMLTVFIIIVIDFITIIILNFKLSELVIFFTLLPFVDSFVLKMKNFLPFIFHKEDPAKLYYF